MISAKTYLNTLLTALMLIPNAALAHGDHGDEASEIQLMEKIRSEQNQFFTQLHEDIANGIPVDIASGQCKYISSIFQRPPAKTVALTFDDGPSSKLTPMVLDTLRKYGIKATFFMKGSNAKANTAIVKRVRDEGHIVASHSYSHPNFHTLSEGQQASEFTTTDGILRNYMPVNHKLFRYPYGNSTCFTNSLSKRQGYAGIVGWHVDSCDWAYASNGYVSRSQATTCGVSAANMANFSGHVLSEVRRMNGGVILMHEIHNRTVQSLEEIIVRLTREGFVFKNLDDPSMAQFLR